MADPVFTIESLAASLRNLRARGWVRSGRPGNDGGVGNTLEDYLDIRENNLAVADAGLFELKARRRDTVSLSTLFHLEPKPGRSIPLLCLRYGWRHQQAGAKYGESELSFRQTLNAVTATDRGFRVVVDRSAGTLCLSYDSSLVGERHAEWLASVNARVGRSRPVKWCK